MEVWKPNRQVQTVPAGTLPRIQATSPFLLHWSSDEWQHSNDTRSQETAIGIEFVDIPVLDSQRGPIRFTFLWLQEDRWGGELLSECLRAGGNGKQRREFSQIALGRRFPALNFEALLGLSGILTR